MKRLVLLVVISMLFFSQAFPQMQWQKISKKDPVEFAPRLVSSTIPESVVEFNLEGFYFSEVDAPRPNSKILSVPRTASISEVGAPDLIQLTAPLIIPDLSNMEIEVIETEYYDIQNVEIAPSKGNFSRSIDPSTVPYTYGAAYQQDAWFPGKLAELSDPHIQRDFRGVIAITYPFQYNPVTKVLRVYNKIVVKVKESKSLQPAVNPMVRTKALTSIVEDFHYIYQDRYLNYNPDKYTAPVERGKILVICYDSFISDMTPYVRWKNQIGFPCEIVGISTIGNTAAQIKTYVTNYYNTNGLAYLLIVGDNAQVATYSYGAAPGGLGTMYSDNYYGDVSGSDSYHEIIVSRFTATTSAHVQTQVQRTLEYEQATSMTSGWQPYGMGIARNEGAGGGHDGGEADYVHMNNIRTRLLAYNYTTVHQDYSNNVPGITNTTRAQISSRINAGVSVINYCNHGDVTLWYVPEADGSYKVSDVNALTNVGKLPFIWSVACLVGNFTYASGDCFAEAWMKATNGSGSPTGAIGVYMSTISQPWVPPMDAQDEFNRVLCELVAGKIRRTYGSISTCGTMFMLDIAPTDAYRLATAKTWTLFGDPSLMVRTDNPTTLTASHPATVNGGTTSMVVTCNTNGAFVTLTKNYQIIGTGTVASGTVTVNFPAVNVGDTIVVTATAYNTVPYQGNVPVVAVSVPIDMQAMSITTPEASYSCSGLSITPQVVIKNMGTNTLTSCTIYYQLNSNPEQSLPWVGSLASMASTTVTLPAFTSTVGNHTFRFRTSAPNGGTDGNTANDNTEKPFTVQDLTISSDFAADVTEFCATPATVHFTNNSANTTSWLWDFGDGTTSTTEDPTHEYAAYGSYSVTLTATAGVCGSDVQTYSDMILVGAAAPVSSDEERCGTGTLTLNASGSGNIVWYSDALGTTQVGTGTSFTTPSLSTTTPYWLGTTISGLMYGGMANNTIITEGGYYTSTADHGLVFNCTAPTVLKSVKVYCNSAGTKTIVLMNGATTVQTWTPTVPSGESRITFNYTLPVGTGLKLLVTTNAPNLYRNGADAVSMGYPFAVGSNITITGGTAAGYEGNYYYYFYDWEVEEACESALSEVTAYVLNVPVAGFSSVPSGLTVDFTYTGSGDNVTYNWDFGDGQSSTDQNPSHTYATGALYTVVLTVTNSCGSDNETINVDLTTVQIEESAADVEIFPNPAQSYCVIEAANLISLVELTDLQGKLIRSIIPSASKVELNLEGIASGLYYVKVTTEGQILVKQLQIK